MDPTFFLPFSEFFWLHIISVSYNIYAFRTYINIFLPYTSPNLTKLYSL